MQQRTANSCGSVQSSISTKVQDTMCNRKMKARSQKCGEKARADACSLACYALPPPHKKLGKKVFIDIVFFVGEREGLAS